ncbi:DUF4304 domain-containing protein [Actinoplanes couchii]|uniref:DUF4304 domain-containing protein n=1 Tax=Actinoplanes couchii TaxID=403638 RepID=A0ABQ3XPP4_9ACTN|nr:DUF4304 domain-containing protein [Actinoplanes couchii]MDR6319137.1 hypothetical protein [Actinoplanes couchii]GID60478.1 hypothetical protein Aco03nite_088820 [Actinoplanes couchii]
MTAQDAFRALVRTHVAPVLRAAGFRSASPTWRLTAPTGDMAIVNVQKSWYNDGDEVNFYVNLAILPVALWDFDERTFPRKRPALPLERDGLLRRRLIPPASSRTRESWVVDESGGCGEILHDLLERTAVPELRSLLDRDRLATVLQSRGHGWWTLTRRDLAAAFALADGGPTPRLARILDDLQNSLLTPADEEKIAWIRRRAGFD